ncbi:putative transcriptional regulator [Friedmanniella endophytica]|uniref:Putative transcriptional regulator n=1 Tax=Microlunatus kandeliicorticis TaxID=1759536 RepID=A0A7W3IPJ0_9ACTN|nr:BlaI/MecI/CopY family transcriptional regulator [Microlunatus kandeliicorticis]MBA8792881.1 putative transcriptional regulator [Microlunatus kandeliicorticis]
MPRLGSLEAEVMALLWNRDRDASAREVLTELNRDRVGPLAYTTVQTVLQNLGRKALLERRKQGRAFHYRPTRTREQHAADLLREVFATSDDRESVLLHFVETMSAAEVERVRAWLDREPEPPERSR